MRNVAPADLRAALLAAGEWHEAGSLHELATVAVASLHELVPCDGVGWNEIDLSTNTTYALTSPSEYLQPERVETLNRLIGEHPIVRYVEQTGDQRAMKISDLVGSREYHRLGLYDEFFRPLGIEDLFAFVIQAEPVIIGVAFTRGNRSFLERDRDLLNLLRPHLAAAHRHLTLRAEAEQRFRLLERGLDGRLVEPLDSAGHIAGISADTRALLARWFGSSSIPPDPGTYERDDVRLTIRRLPGEPALLLFDEVHIGLDPDRVRSFRLSAREADVLALVARGLTDARIAAELFVSPRTVAKHLERAFAKLGVHARAEAVAKLRS